MPSFGRARVAVGVGAIVAGLGWLTAVRPRVADPVPLTTIPAPSPTPALPELLMSRQLMTQAGLHAGDIVTLATTPTGTRTARFKIVDGYEPTPDPMHFTAKRLEVRLHLPDLLSLTSDPTDPQSSESVTALNVALASPEDAGAVRAARSEERRVGKECRL